MSDSNTSMPLRFAILEHRIGTHFSRGGKLESNSSLRPSSDAAPASGAIHWDWMFEAPRDDSGRGETADHRLITWATDPLFTDSPRQSSPWFKFFEATDDLVMATVQLPRHRAVYLEKEGDVGDDRGYVQRIAEGTYEIQRYSEREYDFQVRLPCPGDPESLIAFRSTWSVTDYRTERGEFLLGTNSDELACEPSSFSNVTWALRIRRTSSG